MTGTLALQLCRKELPQRRKGVKQVFIKRKRVQCVWTDTQQTQRESPLVTLFWQFELLLWGISFFFFFSQTTDIYFIHTQEIDENI